jgi:hypothetical protein
MNIGDKEFADECSRQISDMLDRGREVTDDIEDLFMRLYPPEN